MKALLLSGEPITQMASHVITGVRQRIGTCESYMLTSEQLGSLERFFASFIRLSQFDRIVLAMPQSIIRRQSLFLRQLPHLSVLALGKRYSYNDRRLLKRNLHVMPWMRVISDDHQLVHSLIADGYDAAWVSPVVDSERYHPRRRLDLPHNVYAYDPTGTVGNLCGQMKENPPAAIGKEDDLSKLLLPQDVFIYWPNDADKRPHRMMQAMAMGAAVITRDPSEILRTRYRFYDNYNCIFASDAAAALEQLHILRGHPDELRKIALQAAEDAKRFTPIGVGEQLGIALEPEVRKAADYPKRVRVFGFDF